MALKISLKPHERMIIGRAVIKNGSTGCDLLIENKVPILREKDILSQKAADSPCRRIYFAIQLMYVDGDNLKIHHQTYWDLVRDVVKAAPSMLEQIDAISEHILKAEYYKALKLTGKLINYEQEMLNRVRQCREDV